MPRTNKLNELFSHVTEVGYIRPKAGGATTTLNAAAAADDQSLTLAAAAGFADGTIILLDDNESQEVGVQTGAAAGQVVTLKNKIARAHTNGSAVKEAVRTKLGDLTDDGVDATFAEGDFNAIAAATRRGIAAYLAGHFAQMLEFKIENLSLENIAAALGIPEAKVAGVGSQANPYKLDLLPELFATDALGAWYFLGLRKDGSTVEIQAWGAEVDPTGFTAPKFARGQVAPVSFRLRPTAGIRVLNYT